MDKVGMVTFRTQEEAESYLVNLPRGYSGHCYRNDPIKWAVSFRQCTHAVTEKEGFCVSCGTYVGMGDR